jgi:hypothetical protein
MRKKKYSKTNAVRSKKRLQKQKLRPRRTELGSIPSEMVSTARKLCTREERPQKQSRLFLQTNYRKRGHGFETAKNKVKYENPQTVYTAA